MNFAQRKRVEVAMDHGVHVAGRERTKKLLDHCSKRLGSGNESSHLNCCCDPAKKRRWPKKIAPSDLGKTGAPSDSKEMGRCLMAPSDLEESQHGAGAVGTEGVFDDKIFPFLGWIGLVR